ncbi:uncharacterized protein LOC107265766 isoform X2 [Cephus cinctus]|nr:uncharacterized protein LOC107265766 isoform X2 [Cephus cinctus]
MTSWQRCCAYCPGNLARSKDPREHVCNVPKYASGTLKFSSLSGAVRNNQEREERLRGKPKKEREMRFSSCYDNFAIAKKFHTENLQHQPLPDKVDDNVFANFRRAKSSGSLSSCKRNHDKSPCTKQHSEIVTHYPRCLYGPELGCKKPSTYMDLAICWDAPINPDYEPHRPVHIDGSDGGSAPAIFTLVQRGSNIHDNEYLRSTRVDKAKNKQEIPRQCYSSCRCCENRKSEVPQYNSGEKELAKLEERSEHDLCKKMNDLQVTGNDCLLEDIDKTNTGIRARPQHADFLRHCAACNFNAQKSLKKNRRRLIQSASKSQRAQNSRNGLPNSVNVPRPRTPYAKRSFCIDTLTPPFSIVKGCRDADYPEHWRLMSVYQQSYRNPYKQQRMMLNYNH